MQLIGCEERIQHNNDIYYKSFRNVKNNNHTNGILFISDEAAGMYVLELERSQEVAMKNSMDKLEETKVNYIC